MTSSPFRGPPGISAEYVGPRWFGPAYAAMMRRDPHAPGSVDRVLLSRMIGIDPASAPYLYNPHGPGFSVRTPDGRPVLQAVVRGVAPAVLSNEARIRAIAAFTSRSRPATETPIDELRFGGTEEEILARGSDWCTDVSRLACALFQVGGFPSRIVYLGDTARAYSGHSIVETYRHGRWGAIDPLTNVIYLTPTGRPASTWELMVQPNLLKGQNRGVKTVYSRAGQFRRAAISSYRLGDRSEYRYPVSRVNRYYRSVLAMSGRHWPGGLRWIHGEDDR